MKMKTINLDSFCTKFSKDVEANRSTCYNISEYSLKNIFTVSEKVGDEIYLETPEYNKDDVLFNKITETFSGQYELATIPKQEKIGYIKCIHKYRGDFFPFNSFLF